MFFLGFESARVFTLTSIAPFLCFTLVIFGSLRLLLTKRRNKVYLVDFACYKPPASDMWTKEVFMERAGSCGNYSEESLAFMKKTLERSGLGDSTYLPETLRKDPLDLGMEVARNESEMVIFGAIDQLLLKTRVKCKDIGILVVNCSIFNVTPSLSSMIVNRYKFNDNIASYNLGGMGCSAGLTAIFLAKQLLQVRKNSYALVVSTENISRNCYLGNEASMLLINCIFRMGGAAILLSNRTSDRGSSKYELKHTVQTNTASNDRSYNCIAYQEDGEGKVGVTVNRDLIAAAVQTMEANIASLARLFLPPSEQILYFANHVIRSLRVASLPPHVPDFKKAFDHFFPHVGGKPVLDGVQRSLGLGEADMEASRMTLYRFGNTSSSSVWYEVAYAEAMGRIKKGDRLWQIAFGSGFKCTSVVWLAVRTVRREEMNPWSDEIGEFPVALQNNIGPFPFHFEPSA